MKVKTVNGTPVTILSLCGLNLVIVQVDKRQSTSQVDASDLVLPNGCEIPDELTGLHFYDSSADPSAPSQTPEDEPLVAATLEVEE